MVWVCREKTYKLCCKESDEMKRSRGKGRLRKMIKETIKNKFYINELNRNMVLDRTSL